MHRMLPKVLCLSVVMAQCSVVLGAASAVTQGWTVDTLGNLALGYLNLLIQNIWNNFSLYLHPV